MASELGKDKQAEFLVAAEKFARAAKPANIFEQLVAADNLNIISNQ